MAAGTILPGGRILQPYGTELEAGIGPLALAVSHGGKVVTADTGGGVTVIERPLKGAPWREARISVPDVSAGIAFENENVAWVAQGVSGKIARVDIRGERAGRTIDLNDNEWHGSFAGPLLFEDTHHLLYALDLANRRSVTVDLVRGRVTGSVQLEGRPMAQALSPDKKTLWVAAGSSVCALALDATPAAMPECVDVGGFASGVVATEDRVFVTKSHDDAISSVSTSTRQVTGEIPIRFAGLESHKGVMPGGLTFDPLTKWLLVAETGINALAVIDTQKNQVIGHIPVGWMPVDVAITAERAYVVNFAGHGTGPRTPSMQYAGQFGSVTTFVIPSESDLAKTTRTALAAGGLAPDTRPDVMMPPQIKHVVLVVKERHTYDDLVGDITHASNGPVAALVSFARFGLHARARGSASRFSVQDADVTTNHHMMAARWAFSDNFYAQGSTSAEGHRWLEGAMDNPREGALNDGPANERPASETPLWSYLAEKGISVYRSPPMDGLSDEERVRRVTPLVPGAIGTSRPASSQTGEASPLPSRLRRIPGSSDCLLRWISTSRS